MENVEELTSLREEEPTTSNANDELTEKNLSEAIHFTVGHICKEIENENEGMELSRETIAQLAAIATQQLSAWSVDLNAFCKHRKGKSMSPEDVKLLMRHNASALEAVERMVPTKKAAVSKVSRPAKKRTSDRLVKEQTPDISIIDDGPSTSRANANHVTREDVDGDEDDDDLFLKSMDF